MALIFQLCFKCLFNLETAKLKVSSIPRHIFLTCYHYLTPRGQKWTIGEINVDTADNLVRGCVEEAIWHRVQEFVDDLWGWWRIVITGRVFLQRRISGPAETGQFTTVVQQATWEELIALHVLGNIVPVMFAHRWEALSRTPFCLFDCTLIKWNIDQIRQWIWAVLQPKSSAGSLLFEFVLRAAGGADCAWINEVCGQGPVIAIVDVIFIFQTRQWSEFAFWSRCLQTSDKTVLVENQGQSGIIVLPVALSQEFSSSASVISQSKTASIAHLSWNLLE